MPYPEKGADYRRNPEWLKAACRAEGGAAPPPTKGVYDLRSDSDLSDAQQKLNDVGLTGITISPPRK